MFHQLDPWGKRLLGLKSRTHNFIIVDMLTSETDEPAVSEKDTGTVPYNVSSGQMVETKMAGSHSKLKSRHLYMIAMGGKKTPTLSPVTA